MGLGQDHLWVCPHLPPLNDVSQEGDWVGMKFVLDELLEHLSAMSYVFFLIAGEN